MTNTTTPFPPPPPSAQSPPESSKGISTAVMWILGLTILFGGAIIGAIIINDDDSDSVQAPVSEFANSDVLREIWFSHDYCYTDCSMTLSPEEWSNYAGPFNANDAYATAEFLLEDTLTLDYICNEFWMISDDEVRFIAQEEGVDPNTWVGVLYALCDS